MRDNKDSILIVDDTPENLNILIEIMKQDGYVIRSTTRGEKALQLLKDFLPSLILLDINMPEMDGFELCYFIKQQERLNHIPIIFISALNEVVDKVKGFRMGGADYITKPFNNEEVRARVRTHIKNRKMEQELEKYNQSLEGMVAAQIEEIKNAQIATIFALAKLAESRDDDTGRHLERVQTYCRLIAEELSHMPRYADRITPQYIQDIFNASPLHDIGKVGIPDSILLKESKLTDSEFDIMKTHTRIGAETLEAVRKKYPNNTLVGMGISIARHHHENWDGSGYPKGLTGEKIPLPSRIMSIADVYDALRSKRCYKRAFSHKETMDIIIADEGKKFCPDSIRAIRNISDKLQKVYSVIL